MDGVDPRNAAHLPDRRGRRDPAASRPDPRDLARPSPGPKDQPSPARTPGSRSRPRIADTGRSSRRSAPRSRGRGAAWVRNPIDAFILAELEENGLPHAPEADRPTLLRRLSFDLTGLPPTPEEVDAFLADRSPDAYERLVDRLLASPHYGERWAQHWLDLARYADTDGFEFDQARPDAWRYRDWVVERPEPRHALRPLRRAASSPATSSRPTTPRRSSPPGSTAAIPTWST